MNSEKLKQLQVSVHYIFFVAANGCATISRSVCESLFQASQITPSVNRTEPVLGPELKHIADSYSEKDIFCSKLVSNLLFRSHTL